MTESGLSVDEEVMACVDRALNIVGEGGRQVVYEALENRYGFGRDKIPEHLDSFLRITKLYLGTASEAVEKEALYWLKQDTGVEAETLLDAVESFKKKVAATPLPEQPDVQTQVEPPPMAAWKLESQSSVPDVSDERRGAFRYSAKLSFGRPVIKAKKDDPDSREALEAYLRSIVEKHAHHDRSEENDR